jgi:uncharacterized membrane protein
VDLGIFALLASAALGVQLLLARSVESALRNAALWRQSDPDHHLTERLALGEITQDDYEVTRRIVGLALRRTSGHPIR